MAVVTVGPTGRDYTSLATAEATEQQDLTALGETMAFEMDAFADSADGIVIDGWTVSTTYYIIFRCASGVKADLPYTDSGYRLTGGATCVSIRDLYCRFQDMCFITTSTTASRSAFRVDAGGGGEISDRCVFVSSGSGYGGALVLSTNDASQETIFRNCFALILNSTSGNCFDHQGGTGTGHFYNCTAYGGALGFRRSFGTGEVINCLAANTSGNAFDGTWGGSTDYNASDDATAPGSNSRINQTFTFVNTGTGDFRLSSSDAGARDYGTTGSGFTDDFDGETRTGSWDIGADEYIAVGGSSPLLTLLQAHGVFLGGTH